MAHKGPKNAKFSGASPVPHWAGGLQRPPSPPAVWELANASFIFHRWNQFRLFRPLGVYFQEQLQLLRNNSSCSWKYTPTNMNIFGLSFILFYINLSDGTGYYTQWPVFFFGKINDFRLSH